MEKKKQIKTINEKKFKTIPLFINLKNLSIFNYLYI